MYLLFLLVLASFVRFVVPSVASEVNRLIGNLPTTEERLIEVKNRLVESYPSLRQPLNGYLRSALPEERLAVIDLQLIDEAQRRGLSPLQIEEAAVATTAPVGALADYFNKQDQLYLSALMSAQFQRVRVYAPAIINALYRATARCCSRCCSVT